MKFESPDIFRRRLFPSSKKKVNHILCNIIDK
jgi:hypothetical protein